MKKILISITLLIALILSMVPSSNASIEGHTFYLVPHQDDELLTYGVSILNHLWAGHNIHVVLLTDGSESAAIETINSKLENTITKEQFSAARTKEFKRNVAVLGVKEENIHIYDYVDGQLTVDNVKTVVREIKAEYPGARFKAMSYLDNHSDHAATGEALQQLYIDGEVTDARFYLKSSQFGTDNSRPGVVSEPIRVEYEAFLDAGIQSYSMWNPAQGFYAVGYHSVPDLMEQTENEPGSFYHKPGYKR